MRYSKYLFMEVRVLSLAWRKYESDIDMEKIYLVIYEAIPISQKDIECLIATRKYRTGLIDRI